MCDDIYTPLQIQTILQPVFADYKIRKAILFGSYAKGMAQKIAMLISWLTVA